MLSRDKLILSESPLFSILSQPERESIIEASALVSYKKNETILKQGSMAQHLMFFKSGYGKVYHEGSNNKNLILDIIKKNGIAGLNGIFDSDANKYTVASIAASTVLEIPKSVIQQHVEANILFAKSIITQLCHQTNKCYNKLAIIANKQLHGRLADALIFLSQEITEDKCIDMSISRKEIAEMAGISTESAIRILSELNHDGIINLEGKVITIVKKELLMKLSEIG